MIPLTVDPTIVILTDGEGNPVKIATNIAQDLKVISTPREDHFDELAKGRPFVKDQFPSFGQPIGDRARDIQ